MNICPMTDVNPYVHHIGIWLVRTLGYALAITING